MRVAPSVTHVHGLARVRLAQCCLGPVGSTGNPFARRSRSARWSRLMRPSVVGKTDGVPGSFTVVV